jgi:hypothetical protein
LEHHEHQKRVTLDEDLVERLKQEARSRSLPFRQVLNDVLRSGLLPARVPSQAPPFRIKPRCMGTRPGINYDNIAALLEISEDESHR